MSLGHLQFSLYRMLKKTAPLCSRFNYRPVLMGLINSNTTHTDRFPMQNAALRSAHWQTIRIKRTQKGGVKSGGKKRCHKKLKQLSVLRSSMQLQGISTPSKELLRRKFSVSFAFLPPQCTSGISRSTRVKR